MSVQPSALAPVSVVVPCWRCAVTVGRALESALRQTLPPAQIVLVDDASDDEGATRAALQRLAAAHAAAATRIDLVLLDANVGPGGARNAGWDRATEPYVAFLDADDAWHPRKLEIQTRWMDAHPEVALTGHPSMLAGEGAPAVIDERPEARPVSAWAMLVSNRLPARSVMLRRTLPFRFRDRRYAEDYLLWLEIICAGHRAWRLEAPLALHFRPEFGRGGYSGELWAHERRELAALAALRRAGRIGILPYAAASAWSLVKFVRRLGVAAVRRGRG